MFIHNNHEGATLLVGDSEKSFPANYEILTLGFGLSYLLDHVAQSFLKGDLCVRPYV